MHSVQLDGKVKKLEVKEKMIKFAICEKEWTKEGEPEKFVWFNVVAFGKTMNSLRGLAEGDFISLQCNYSTSEYQGKTYSQFIVRGANFNRPQQQGQGYPAPQGGYNQQANNEPPPWER
jgi:hypothetical protein